MDCQISYDPVPVTVRILLFRKKNNCQLLSSQDIVHYQCSKEENKAQLTTIETLLQY